MLETNLNLREVAKVVAFAGTGKTSTPVEFVKRRPHQTFLEICFNKAIQLEAASKFSNKNCITTTMHSLAYNAMRHFFPANFLGDYIKHSGLEAASKKELLKKKSYEKEKLRKKRNEKKSYGSSDEKKEKKKNGDHHRH